ncbi:response regulator [Cognaticolwellia mytili]|uniref:response regulator n=1 Tax=Cognaticolwellia mytili TaxID=1888913 RepID=UPI000A1773EA|nr:response regulator [Cognaticolwellia mytili]
MARILVVEDEIKIAQLLYDYMAQAQFNVTMLHDGAAVIEELQSQTYDMVLLDLMLPVKDGLTLCKEIRIFSNIPIIMITARVEEIDRLIGLELGADDYICKPFSPREVVARVKATLRRYKNPDTETIKKPIFLNEEKYQATLYGQAVELTAIEFNLLKVLSKEPGRIYSRAQLINQVYNDHRVVSERTIDSHIKKLRKKINSLNADSEIIQSVYSVGYKVELG